LETQLQTGDNYNLLGGFRCTTMCINANISGSSPKNTDIYHGDQGVAWEVFLSSTVNGLKDCQRSIQEVLLTRAGSFCPFAENLAAVTLALLDITIQILDYIPKLAVVEE
jgi:hypothetical protein